MKQHSLGLLLASTALSGALGCTPSLQQIQEFGASTAAVAQLAEQGFQLADRQSVDAKKLAIARGHQPLSGEDDFVGMFTVEQLTVRISVLRALQDYAAALETLARVDTSEDLAAASTELRGALKGLDESAGKLASAIGSSYTNPQIDDQLHLIATVVYGLGRAYAEKKRREAIVEVISTADKVVQKVVTLLETELGPTGVLPSAATGNWNLVIGVRVTQYKALVEDQQKKDANRDWTSSRLKQLDIIEQTIVTKRNTIAFFTTAALAATRVGTAHTALAEATANTIDSKTIVAAVSALTKEAKALGRYYQDLAKE